MNYVKELFQSSDKQEYETARKKCITFVEKRRDCWKDSVSGNKHTEQCFIEELAEKKCMSECLCKDIYIYPEPQDFYFSEKYREYLGKFIIINNSTKYIHNYKKVIILPLNIRFFLLKSAFSNFYVTYTCAYRFSIL